MLVGGARSLIGTAATAQVQVKGHFRKEGTYVAPSVRSAANSSRLDNFSSRPNYNPTRASKGRPIRMPCPHSRLAGHPSHRAPPLGERESMSPTAFFKSLGGIYAIEGH
jgi:hypothetical protein